MKNCGFIASSIENDSDKMAIISDEGNNLLKPITTRVSSVGVSLLYIAIRRTVILSRAVLSPRKSIHAFSTWRWDSSKTFACRVFCFPDEYRKPFISLMNPFLRQRAPDSVLSFNHRGMRLLKDSDQGS